MNPTLKLVQKNRDEVLSVAELLYGDGAWEISKALTDRQKRVGTAALSAVGATAGAAGLAYAGKKFGEAAVPAYKASKKVGKFRKVGEAVKTGAKHEPFGTALVPLEVAGLGGEVMATKILHSDTKQKKNPTVVKRLRRAAMEEKISKSDTPDIQWRGEISKMDDDKRQVFGWASIVEVNGEPVVDLQGDYLSVDEIEKAAYNYVRKSRVGGNQHQKGVHVSDMIESFLVTPEKKQQMGLPEDTPTGWWVGFQVNDEDTWQQVKRGERKEFSIHGSGIRKDIDL